MKMRPLIRHLRGKLRVLFFRLTLRDSTASMRWLLARRSLKGAGIEVGALFNPLPVPRGDSGARGRG